MKYYIYIYYHPVTNKPFYVGKGSIGGKKWYNRKKEHLLEAKRYEDIKGNRLKFYTIKNLLKQGLEPKIEVVFQSDNLEEVKQKEIELISKYGRRDLRTGILTNLTSGGDGCIDISEETKTKISNSLKDRINIPNKGQFKKKYIPHNKGVEMSDKMKARISESLKNKYKTDPEWAKLTIESFKKRNLKNNTKEASKKRSESLKKSYANGIREDCYTNISQYSKKGELIKVWKNTREIYDSLKITSENITPCLRNERKTSGGYKWRID